MFSIALCSMKGGTGKTTLSFNLVERGASAGLRVALVDYDPQEGSYGLMSLRAEPARWTVHTSRVSVDGVEFLVGLRRQANYDLAVCDLPGADSLALARLLREMDLIISPVGQGAPDLLAAANFLELIKPPPDLPVWFAPNLLPPGTRRRANVLAELEELGGKAAPVALCRRVALSDALRFGRGVCEVSPTSQAAAEVSELWNWVAEKLDFPAS